MQEDKSIPADVSIGGVWMPEDLLPWLPSAISVMSKMVLENVLLITPENASWFGGNFFTGAQIIAKTLQAAKVNPETINHAISDMSDW